VRNRRGGGKIRIGEWRGRRGGGGYAKVGGAEEVVGYARVGA
jgi:hypothetical protein